MRIKVDISKLPSAPYGRPRLPQERKPDGTQGEKAETKEPDTHGRKKRDWSKVRRGDRSRFYTPEQDTVIREMRAQGRPYKEIAERLGRGVDAVRSRAKVIRDSECSGM